MLKFIRACSLPIVLILVAYPFRGICQVDTPEWVSDIGGPNSNCISSSVKVDQQNNIYITGLFDGTADFDPSPGVYNLTAPGGSIDTYVAKYNTNGALIWAVAMGGSDFEQVNSMGVDKDGNVIISGQFNSSNFDADPGPGSSMLSSNGDYDAFFIKLDANGAFVWAKAIGGGSADYGGRAAADSEGNAIVTVRFQATVNVGGTNYTSQGNFNGLIIKYGPAGNLLWTVNLKDNDDCQAGHAEIDHDNNVVVCGTFNSNVNFNPLGTSTILNGNGASIFIAKYTPAGVLTWVKPILGQLISNNGNVCVNSNNDIFISGPFSSTLSFNSTILNPSGGQDLFLAKYSSAGTFQGVKDIGGKNGNGSIFNYGIVASQDDNIYLSGYFSGTIDFNPSPTDNDLISYHGQRDFFLSKFDEDLNYKWAFGGGSPNCVNTMGRNVAVDNNNDILFTGGFCSTVNFSALTCSPYALTAKGNVRDTYLAKYVQNAASPTLQITGFSVPQQISPAIINQNSLKITVTVPIGTNVMALSPSIIFTNTSQLTPGSGVPRNFNTPATYTLSSNCTSLNYVVEVVFASSATPQEITVCHGSQADLTGEVANPVPDSYLWQILQNNVWQVAPGANNTPDYKTSLLSNTTNSAIILKFRRQIDVQGNISDDSYYDITVRPQVQNNNITLGTLTTFCSQGNPAIITGSTPTGGTGTYTYQWQASSNGTTFVDINGATAQTYDPPLITNTIYYRRMVTSQTCSNVASNVVNYTVTPLPTTPVPTNITVSICAGNTTSFSISAPDPAITYRWYTDAGRANLVFTGTTYVTGVLNANTAYYIEAVNGSCVSSNLATVQANVTQSAVAPSVDVQPQVCPGTSVSLTVNNIQPGAVYKWYNTVTGGLPVFTGSTFNTNVTQSVVYYAEADNGCPSQRTPVVINVYTLPDAPALANQAICPGTSAVIDAQQGSTVTVNWYETSLGGNRVFTGPVFTTPQLSSNTIYYVEVASNISGCTSARTQVNINMASPLNAPLVNVGTTTMNSVTFNWSNVTGAMGYEVSSDNGQTFTNIGNTLNYTVNQLTQAQTVSLIVRAFGALPCQTSSASASVTGTAIDPLAIQIFVPNMFSPNGDGNNDILYVRSPAIKSIIFYVYNQWGEMIFRTDNQANGWNGTYKGAIQPVGVYVYYAEMVLLDGEKVNKKGSVTLLR